MLRHAGPQSYAGPCSATEMQRHGSQQRRWHCNASTRRADRTLGVGVRSSKQPRARPAISLRALKDDTRATAVEQPAPGSEQAGTAHPHGARSMPAHASAAARPAGLAALLGVTLLWGTYVPTLRFLFQQDAAVSPQAVTACRTLLAAGALLLAAAAAGSTGPARQQGSAEGAPQPSSGTRPAGALALLLAGGELGLYNFCGTAAQAVGVGMTSATKAAFLGQVVAVLTPTLAWLSGQPVAPLYWAACATALAGSCLITLDGMQPAAAAAAAGVAGSGGQGELYVLAGCAFYAMTTVRLSTHAPRFNPLHLAAAKTTTLAAASLAWLLASEAGGAGIGSLVLPRALTGGVGGALLVYSGVGPGALAALLQAQGQASMPAVQAQVLYSLTPVWSALLAAALLPGEQMGAAAWGGAAVIFAASVAVAVLPAGRES